MKNMFGDPILRVMEGPTVIVEFLCVNGRWTPQDTRSKARQRFVERRMAAEEAALAAGEVDLWDIADAHIRDDLAHNGNRWRLTELVGDTPLHEAFRPEWHGLPPRSIPGYREVLVLGQGRTFRTERLYPLLTKIHEVGQGAVQLDTLGKVYETACATKS
ncbi:hypothetical protein ACI8AC_14655 [Geodermatophilus sp. SYSU D00758]